MQSNAITKDLIKQITYLNEDLMSIDIIVSFIRMSGYREIEPMLTFAKNEGIPVRILTSTYMNITEPVALSRLLDILGDGVVRMYNGQAESFHPKAYFFNCINTEDSHVFVGSSNISKPALTNGIEWNYRVLRANDSSGFEAFKLQFEHLYAYQSYELTEGHIKDYRETLIVPDSERRNSRINIHFNRYRQPSVIETPDHSVQLYKPKSAQIEALYELEETRQQGNDKALIVAATGIGKTYLAAFDSEGFDSVLFVAHREEILNQAADTFAKIRGGEAIGRFNQHDKETNKKLLFASVQSLSRKEQLQKFKPKQFDYIVIDEFHHASAPSYRKIVEYFEPKFMLGLTATPHRLDIKDVFQICDYNVPYEVSLFNAINRDW